MFAVVNIAGHQFKVEEKGQYYVPKLKDTEPDTNITFDEVLMYTKGKETKVGSPTVEGIKVEAKVLEHTRDETVLVFKKKKRKSYQKMNGHRQHLTKIEIKKIG